jgi:hypothetical protein
MHDDGTGGDVLAGDGVYSGSWDQDGVHLTWTVTPSHSGSLSASGHVLIDARAVYAATRVRTRYELVPCGPIPCSLEVRNVPSLGVDGMQTGQRMSRACHRMRTEAGTSLTELMCAMAAGLVVLGATLQALSYFNIDL